MKQARALLVFALLGLPGCYSKITAYDQKFTIGYASPLVQVENFVKPIAPGAKLDLHVFTNGTSDKLTLVKAVSSKPSVLAVDKVSGETLTVLGGAPGGAELTITARGADGVELTDKMFFHVAKPASHKLEHSCTEDREAVYVRGASIDVFHSMATADNRAVIGYGWVPVAIEPAGALELTAQPQAGTVYRYTSASAQKQVTVRSLVDGTKLSLRVVDGSEITSARLHAADRMLVGQHDYVFAQTQLGPAPICNQNALTRARSLTPDICRVTARLDDSLDDSNREQLAEVTGLKYGTCELEVTLPELAGGRGITLRHKRKVGKVDYPSELGRGWWVGLGLAQLIAIVSVVRAFRSLRRAQR